MQKLHLLIVPNIQPIVPKGNRAELGVSKGKSTSTQRAPSTYMEKRVHMEDADTLRLVNASVAPDERRDGNASMSLQIHGSRVLWSFRLRAVGSEPQQRFRSAYGCPLFSASFPFSATFRPFCRKKTLIKLITHNDPTPPSSRQISDNTSGSNTRGYQYTILCRSRTQQMGGWRLVDGEKEVPTRVDAPYPTSLGIHNLQIIITPKTGRIVASDAG